MNTLCTHPPCALQPNSGDRGRRIQTNAKGMRARFNSSTVVKFLINAKQQMLARYQQRVNRKAIQKISTLDDHMLKDIGVTRYDVKWASRLPLSEDAAAKLEIIARRR